MQFLARVVDPSIIHRDRTDDAISGAANIRQLVRKDVGRKLANAKLADLWTGALRSVALARLCYRPKRTQSFEIHRDAVVQDPDGSVRRRAIVGDPDVDGVRTCIPAVGDKLLESLVWRGVEVLAKELEKLRPDGDIDSRNDFAVRFNR